MENSTLLLPSNLDKSLFEDLEWLSLLAQEQELDELLLHTLDAALKKAPDRSQWYSADSGLPRSVAMLKLRKRKQKGLPVLDLLSGIVSFDEDLLRKTSVQVVKDLSCIASRNSPFAVSLRKRFHILQRIQLALLRQRERQKRLLHSNKTSLALVQRSDALSATEDEAAVEEIDNDQLEDGANQSASSPLVQINLSLFRCLLKTLKHMEAEYVLDVLASFQEILGKLPPLSLRNEPRVSMDALRSFLLSFASASAVSSSSLVISGAEPAKQTLIRSQALTSLITLGIARGSLNGILWILNRLLVDADQNEQADKQLQLPVNGYSPLNPKAPTTTFTPQAALPDRTSPLSLKKTFWAHGLFTANSSKNIPPLPFFFLVFLIFLRLLFLWDGPFASLSSPSSAIGGSNCDEAYECERHDEIFSGPEPYDPRHIPRGNELTNIISQQHCSIAVDGTEGSFIYLLDERGLVKVGTGREGTTQGVTYVVKEEYRSKEKGWLTCVGRKLYYRSPHIAPATLLVLNADTLEEEGTIMQDGTGSIVTSDNTDTYFSPEESTTKISSSSSASVSSSEAGSSASSTLSLPFSFASGTNSTLSLSPPMPTTPPLTTITKSSATSTKSSTKASKYTSRSPLISDGQFLYIIYSAPVDSTTSSSIMKSKQKATVKLQKLSEPKLCWRVSKFDPSADMKFISSVDLKAHQQQQADKVPLLWSKAQVSYVGCGSSLTRFASGAALVGKRILMLGGAANYIYNGVVDALDLSSETGPISWTQPSVGGAYTSAFDSHTVCLVGKDRSRRAAPPATSAAVSSPSSLFSVAGSSTYYHDSTPSFDFYSGGLSHPASAATTSTSSNARKIIVFGGKNAVSAISALHYLDTEKMEWSVGSPAGKTPPKRYSHCAAAAGENKTHMYIFGGVENKTRYNDLHYLDTEQNRWIEPKISNPKKIPSARSNATLTAINTTTLLLFGGFDGTHFLNDLHYYDTVTCSWHRVKARGEVPTPRAGHSATLIGNVLYVFGGRLSKTQRTNELYALDVETFTWSYIPCKGVLPSPRASHCAVAVGTKLFIIAGRSEKGPEKGVFALQTDSSILFTKHTIEAGASFFTNGRYLGMLVPPGIFPNPSSDNALFRAYSLEDGCQMLEQSVKHSSQVGAGTCFDCHQGIVWNYSANDHKIAKWQEHNALSGGYAPFSPNAIWASYLPSLPPSSSSSSSSTMVEREKKSMQCIDATAASLLILAQLDHLARNYVPSLSDLLVHGQAKLPPVEPFCIELGAVTFQRLFALLQHAASVLIRPKKAEEEGGEGELDKQVYICVAVLRLLKVNLYRALLLNLNMAQIGLALPASSSTDSQASNATQESNADKHKKNGTATTTTTATNSILIPLRSLLLQLISLSKPRQPQQTKQERMTQRLLYTEASDVFITAFDIFYPKSQNKADLFLNLLFQTQNTSVDASLSSSSEANSSHLPSVWAANKLLKQLIQKYSVHPNLSSMVTASSSSSASTSSITPASQHDDKPKKKQHQPPKPGVEVLSKLLDCVIKDAQLELDRLAAMGKNEASATDSNPSSSSPSPTLRLVKAIQRDLLSRAAASLRAHSSSSSFASSTSSVPKTSKEAYNVLISYAMLLLNQAVGFASTVITTFVPTKNKPTANSETTDSNSNEDDQPITTANSTIANTLASSQEVQQLLRTSFFGVLVPALLTGLCLLPKKKTWSHKFLVPLIELAALLDQLNSAFPSSTHARSKAKHAHRKQAKQAEDDEEEDEDAYTSNSKTPANSKMLTGVDIESSNNWLMDVEKLVGHLGGILSGASIAGDTPTSDEEKYKKWLESKLFSRGLEAGNQRTLYDDDHMDGDQVAQQLFLTSLSENQEKDAMLFVEFMDYYVAQEDISSLVNLPLTADDEDEDTEDSTLVRKATRAVTAALIKHNGITQEAMNFAQFLNNKVRLEDLRAFIKSNKAQKEEEEGTSTEDDSDVVLPQNSKMAERIRKIHPPFVLIHIWFLVQKDVKAWLQRNKVLSVDPIGSASAGGSNEDRGLDDSSSSTQGVGESPVAGNDAKYHDLVKGVIAKAGLMLKLKPQATFHASTSSNTTTNAQPYPLHQRGTRATSTDFVARASGASSSSITDNSESNNSHRPKMSLRSSTDSLPRGKQHTQDTFSADDTAEAVFVPTRTRSHERIVKRSNLNRSLDGVNTTATAISPTKAPSHSIHNSNNSNKWDYSKSILELWKLTGESAAQSSSLAATFGSRFPLFRTASSSSTSSTTTNNTNNINSALNAASARMKMMQQRRSEAGKALMNQSEIERSFFRFIQSNLPVQPLQAFIKLRRKRAERRKAGLEAIHTLLQSVSFVAVKREILKFLAPALRAKRQHGVSQNYLHDIKPCGADLEKALSASLRKLFHSLARLLKISIASVCTSSSSQPHHRPTSGKLRARTDAKRKYELAALKLLIMDAWGSVIFHKEDHQFLHRVGIFSILARFISYSPITTPPLSSSSSATEESSKQEDPALLPKNFSLLRGLRKQRNDIAMKNRVQSQRLREAAWLAFRFLAMSICPKKLEAFTHELDQDSTSSSTSSQEDVSSSSSDGKGSGEGDATKRTFGYSDTRHSLNELQKTIYELIFAELEKVLENNPTGLLPPSVMAAASPLSLGSDTFSSSSSSTSSTSLQVAEGWENYAFNLLCLLFNLTNSPQSRLYISAKRLLRLLLFIVPKGTPRIQRLVLRLLRRVLPYVSSPESLDYLVHSDKPLLHSLFEFIGRASWQPSSFLFNRVQRHQRQQEQKNREEAETNNNKSEQIKKSVVVGVEACENGHVAVALAAEVVMLLRTLLAKDSRWRRALTTFITNSLANIPPMLEHLRTRALFAAAAANAPASSSPEEKATSALSSFTFTDVDVWHVIASFSIIGGHSDGLRVGGHVEVVDKGKKHRGIVVCYDRTQSRAKVLTESHIGRAFSILLADSIIGSSSSDSANTSHHQSAHNPNKTDELAALEWIAVNKLSPVCEVPMPGELFPLTEELLPSFACFLDSSPTSPVVMLNDLTHSLTQHSPTSVAMLLAQLKWRSIKALDVLLSCRSGGAGVNRSVGCFLDGGLLPSLIRMAQPSALKLDSSNLSQLEEKSLLLEETCHEFGVDQRLAGSFIAELLGEQQPRQSDEEGDAKSKVVLFSPREGKDKELEPEPQQPDSSATSASSTSSIKATSTSRAMLEDKIPHSPFRYLPFKIPTHMTCEQGTSPDIMVDEEEGDERTFTCLCRNGNSSNVTLLHSDTPIPDALPAFYFEVRIVEVGRRAHNNDISIGLYPSSEKMYGMPGWYNGSLGFNSQQGFKYHHRNPGCGDSYGPAFGRGDVVGCGWTKWDGKVFFTKNGQHLGTAFKHVSATRSYYAVVGLVEYGARVTVNFGQEPFRFPFADMLAAMLKKSAEAAAISSPDSVTQTGSEQKEKEKEDENKAKDEEKETVNAEEKKTEAMPTLPSFSFPSLSSSSLYAALPPPPSSLPLSTPSPLQPLLASISSPTPPTPQRESEEPDTLPLSSFMAEEQEEFDLSDDETEESTWTHVPSSNSLYGNIPHRRSRMQNRRDSDGEDMSSSDSSSDSEFADSSRLFDDDDEPPQEEDEAPQDTSYSFSDSSSSPSLLFNSSRFGNSIPNFSFSNGTSSLLGSRRSGGRSRVRSTKSHQSSQQKLHIDKLKLGTWLTVKAKARQEHHRLNVCWYNAMDKTIGKVGLVKEVDAENDLVLLQFYDPETSTKMTFWYCIAALKKASRASNATTTSATGLLLLHNRRTKAPHQEEPQQTETEIEEDPIRLKQELKAYRELTREVLYNSSAMFDIYARSTVLSVISHWPSSHAFSLDALGGYSRLIDVLELSASECLAKGQRSGSNSNNSNNSGSNASSNSPSASSASSVSSTSRTSMEMLRWKLQEILGEEVRKESLRKTQQKADKEKKEVKGEKALGSSYSTTSFAYKICMECLRHLKESASMGSHWASGFTITKDKALQLLSPTSSSTTKQETSLEEQEITNDENNNVNKSKKPNILLGSWLLDLLLEYKECHAFVRKVFYVDIYDALLSYVSTVTTPSKGRIFPLLSKLVNVFGFPTRHNPNLLRYVRHQQSVTTSSHNASSSTEEKERQEDATLLHKYERSLEAAEWSLLETQMDKLYNAETSSGSPLHSSCLQRLIELMVAWRTEKDYLQQQQEKEEKKEEKHKEKQKDVEGYVLSEDIFSSSSSGGIFGSSTTATDWFKGLIAVSKVMDVFHRRDPLPTTFMCRVWLETQIPFVVVESAHPYGDKEDNGKVSIVHAKELCVNFDKRSKIDQTASLYFSKLQDGGENLHKWSGTISPRTVTIPGQEFYWQFQPQLKGIGAIHEYHCRNCNEGPIIGILYSCANCDYHLCSNCEETTHTGRYSHSRLHAFLKIRRPLPSDHNRHKHLAPLYRHGDVPPAPSLPIGGPLGVVIGGNVVGSGSGGSKKQQSAFMVEHEGVACDGCGVSPIRGIRYKCVNCVEYNLCSKCEDENKGTEHNDAHAFLKLRHPIRAKSVNAAAKKKEVRSNVGEVKNKEEEDSTNEKGKEKVVVEKDEEEDSMETAEDAKNRSSALMRVTKKTMTTMLLLSNQSPFSTPRATTGDSSSLSPPSIPSPT
ncbi:negative regulation of SNARE complex assembly [Balamuthia mandrillaris]